MITRRGDSTEVRMGLGKVAIQTGRNLIARDVMCVRLVNKDDADRTSVCIAFRDMHSIDALIDVLQEVRIALTGQIRPDGIVTGAYKPGSVRNV